MTSIFKKPPAPEPGAVSIAGQSRIDAARRLSTALAEAGDAMRSLLEAERTFNSEAGSGNQMRFSQQLYPFLVGEMNLSAPELAKYLRLPHLPPSRCESIASLVARQVDGDLASVEARKEVAA